MFIKNFQDYGKSYGYYLEFGDDYLEDEDEYVDLYLHKVDFDFIPHELKKGGKWTQDTDIQMTN